MLIPGGEGWTLWRWFVLRGAGFEANRVLRLALPDLESRIRSVEAAEHEYSTIRASTVDMLTARIASGNEGTGRRLSKLRKKISAGNMPQGEAAAELGVASDVEAVRACARQLEAQLADLDRYIEQHAERLALDLNEQARDPRFREALSWQNPNALHTGVEHLLRQPPGASDSQTRQHAQLVASYLQRYCVKNDTIGFFGPLAWGRLTDGPAVVVEPTARLVSKRAVYFEHWAAESLARTFSSDPHLIRWAMPRRWPTVVVEEGLARAESGPPIALSAGDQWLLNACNGATTARAIALDVKAPDHGFESEQAVYDQLKRFSERRLISWQFEIPTEVDDPMSTLAALIQNIDEPVARARADEAIGALMSRRAALATAGGEPERVEQALRELSADFVRVTGASATRRGGQTYAGRMLVYEDCVRGGDVSLGPDFVRWVSEPLSALLISARWFTHELAHRYRGLLLRVFRDLGSTAPISLTTFLRAAAPLFRAEGNQPPAELRAVRRQLTERWSTVLADPAAHLAGDELRRIVAAAFPAPSPGWPLARYHSPDLQIAASNVDAVQRGDFTAVLGELHVGCPTVLAPFLLRHHPTPQALIEAREIDVPPPCVAAVTGHETFDRSELTSRSLGDLHVELRDTKSWRDRSHVLAVADLVVGMRGDQLEVSTRDGSRRFDVIAFFERYLISLATREFHIGAGESHSPRVTLGRMVVARETWRLDPRDATFAWLDTPNRRFVEAVRWSRRLGLPRHSFYKVPEETKPCYVDFHSPLYVENLAKIIRRASTLTFSEMLPGHEALWLEDAAGGRYTCELRFVAVDPVPWSPPP